jgi:hypothetical protein
MKKLFNEIYKSFKNLEEDRLSARKLTSFAFVCFCGYIHIAHVDKSNAVSALTIDGIVLLLLLGIITAQNVIQFKHGKQDNQTN